MKRLAHIVDSSEYILGNSFQHQIFQTLANKNDVEYQMFPLATLNNQNWDYFDVLLSGLKLRSLYNNLPRIKNCIGATPLYVYEQDPFVSFIDQENTYKGSYEKIYDTLNVKSFINTTKWWSDYINAKGMRSVFTPMWILPEYCSRGNDWVNRKIDYGFKGQLHSYRKTVFDKLKADYDIEVQALPGGDYQSYLDDMRNMKFFFHIEDSKWSLNGEKIKNNALWGKDVEALSQGCFVLREYEDEVVAYELDKIPTMITYNSLDEIPNKIKEIMAKKPIELAEMRVDAVNSIRENRGWLKLADILGV